LGLDVPEPVETYSSSPHLYTDLDIPEGTKGRLPRNKRTLAGVDAEVLEDLGETGKKNSRGGRERDGRGRTRSGGREGSREGRGAEAGRSGERRRRTSSGAAESPAAGTETAPGSEAEKPTRARRTRTRTRRRNGEVVAGVDKGTQSGTAEG
jgi:hypothetical protein